MNKNGCIVKFDAIKDDFSRKTLRIINVALSKTVRVKASIKALNLNGERDSKMIKAIFFDLDDTLLWDQKSVKEAFVATCSKASEKFNIDAERL